MQWVIKKRSYWEFGELLNPGVKTLIYATDPKGIREKKHLYMSMYVEEPMVTLNMNCTLPEPAVR